MISFICGKPRGGKTLYGVRLLLDELMKGTRTIVTNLPLHRSRIVQYILEKSGKLVDLEKRLVSITDNEMLRFWEIRDSARLAGITVKDGMKLEGEPSPTLYVLDELHLYFNSRNWKDVGPDCLYYVSQHGKLGDDIVCITQFPGNVDKQFRVLSQDFVMVRNYANERMAGFRMPSIFRWKSFQELPGKMSPVSETGSFTMDVEGAASCYDTRAGVGVRGQGDMGRRRSGMPWWIGAGAIVLIVGLLAFVPMATGRMMGAAAKHVIATAEGDKSMSQPAVAPLPPILPNIVQTVPTNQLASIEPVQNEIFMTGRCIVGKMVRVYLSDGRVLDQESVTDLSEYSVRTKSGKEYRLQPAQRSEVPFPSKQIRWN